MENGGGNKDQQDKFVEAFYQSTNCLGKMSLFGDGTRIDNCKAFCYFTQSAEYGSSDGRYWSGYMHEYK